MTRKLHRIIRAINFQANFVKISSIKQFFLAALGGVFAVAGFAPLSLFLVPILALVLLFWLWQRADSPRAAFGLGWCFGLGLFGAGVGWLYVALYEFGNMPAPLALLALLLFGGIYLIVSGIGGIFAGKITHTDMDKVLSDHAITLGRCGIVAWLYFYGIPMVDAGILSSVRQPIGRICADFRRVRRVVDHIGDCRIVGLVATKAMELAG